MAISLQILDCTDTLSYWCSPILIDQPDSKQQTASRKMHLLRNNQQLSLYKKLLLQI